MAGRDDTNTVQGQLAHSGVTLPQGDRSYIRAKVRQRILAPDATAQRIGRYRVLEPIGSGGMGLVYAAYDDKLDRRVALKILRDKELPTEELRLRFLREAQALARLSHSNVVTVHEVSDHEGEMFLAMEFVQGQDLREWLEHERAPSEVLEAFVQAGRGLMAAHEAGLVHRDFKPANAVRSDDGTVKVLDFGLARQVDAGSDSTVETLTFTNSSTLTIPGQIMGTPAYMSPEQHVGGELDPRSDQYSFCVSVWEGLVGEHPFALLDYLALINAKRKGPPSWPSSVGPSPERRVVEALRRGLAVDPEDRWPSMAPLLDALELRPRRRLWVMSSLGAGLVGLGVGALVFHASSDEGPPPCSGAAQQLAGIWDEPRRAEIEAAILGIDKSYATDVWARAERVLDDYASLWVATYTDTCEAMAADDDPSSQVLGLMQTRCLQRASHELRATVDVLASADAGVVQRAHELTDALPALVRCADADVLTADVEPPPANEVVAVDEVRRELARSRSLMLGGRYEDALAAVDTAGEGLRAVEYGPIRTEYARARGEVLRYLGEHDAAEKSLGEALELGVRYGQRAQTSSAVRSLISLVGTGKKLMDEALRYRPLAMGLTEGAPLERAQVRQVVATVLHERGAYPEAEIEYRSALAQMRRELGADAPMIASTRLDLGFALLAMGRKDDAEVEQRAGLATLEASLGSTHPELARARTLLGNTLADQKKLDEAVAEYREALTIYESALGANHPKTLGTRGNFAVILKRRGDLQQAEVELREMLPLLEELHGAEHLRVALTRTNYSGVLLQLGRPDEAEAQLRSSLEIFLGALPSDHLNVIATRVNLGNALIEQQHYEEAEAEFRLGIEALEQSYPPEHHFLGAARAQLASLLASGERFEEARPIAEAAWKRQRRDDVLAEDQATAAFALARVLWNVKAPHRDRSRARSLAELAADALETYKGPQSQLPEIRRWLESHPVE